MATGLDAIQKYAEMPEMTTQERLEATDRIIDYQRKRATENLKQAWREFAEGWEVGGYEIHHGLEAIAQEVESSHGGTKRRELADMIFECAEDIGRRE